MVCGISGRTKTTGELHKGCGQLTVNQMIVLRAMSREITVSRTERPLNLYNMLDNTNVEYQRNLRSFIRELQLPRKGRYHDKTWRNYFLTLYKGLPENIKSLKITRGGKLKLRAWSEKMLLMT